jgi:hypothetical protein
LRRRKPTNLFIDDPPIEGKRPVQTSTASIFRHEAHTDDEAIRLPDKQFSFRTSPPRSIFSYELRSGKMLFGEECH